MVRRRYTPRYEPTTEPTEEDRRNIRLAIQNLNRMIPQLRFFARNITGNPSVQIKVSSDIPHTRGNVISIRPPLGLASSTSHTRSSCGIRNSNGRQECPACQLREVIEFFLFHEISHVAFNTQEKSNSRDLQLVEKFINEWHPVGACRHGAYLRGQIEYGDPRDCQNLGGILSDHIARIFNCLEDARVNERMFDARPGMRTVFNLNIERLMTEGTESGVDKYETWMDAPRDAQFMVGLSIKACGISVENRLHPLVVEALADSRLESICRRAATSADAHEIFALSMETFRVAQEVGFCVVPKCELPSLDQEPPSSQAPPSDPENTGDSRENVSEDKKGDQPRAESTDDSGQSDPGAEGNDGDPGSTGDRNEGADSSGEDAGEDDDSSDSSEESDSNGSDRPEDNGDSSEGGSTEGDVNENNGDDESSGGSSDGSSDNRGNDDQDEDGSRTDPRNGLSSNAGKLHSEEDNQEESSSESGESDNNREGEVSDEEDSVEERANEDHPVGESTNPWDTAAPDATGAHFDGPSVPVGGPMGASLPVGTPDEIDRALSRFLMHGIDGKPGMLDEVADGDHESVVGTSEHGKIEEYIGDLITSTFAQILFFDTVSGTVSGIEIPSYPNYKIGWQNRFDVNEFKSNENIVGGAILKARRVFSDNKRYSTITNQKSGRINTRVLGRRAPLGDPRLFSKRTLPGKKDYFVVIGLDCSFSTNDYDRNAKIKRIAFSQAEILHRLGVPWSGFGHTAARSPLGRFKRNTSSFSEYFLYMLPFKTVNEPWNASTQEKLANIAPVSENLDGHTLEFYRKEVQKSTATDRIIIYFTDGEMPMANYAEEREILEREIAICKREGIHLLGVGINTDSPKQYGMDTVRVDCDEDIVKVIEQLDRRLSQQ